MKKNLFGIFCVSLFCLLMTTVGFSQKDTTLSSAAGDVYLISAKAGVVNYVEGRVLVKRSNGESGYLVKGDKLEVGDKVSTISNSRAEVLLNPGSYARLDQNSSFEFFTTNLDDLKLQVNRGSVLFEVFASDDFKVTVTTPKAKFYLIDTGVYRVDVLNNGIGKVEVHRGKAQIGTTTAERLKKGRTAIVDGNSVAVAKFNRGNKDSFEVWSKSRAKLIAKANKRLSDKRRNSNQLARSVFGTQVNCYQSLGLWVFDRHANNYSFLPFGYGWRSPYGFGLRTSTSVCNYPYYSRHYRYNPKPRTRTSGGGTSTTGRTAPAENVRRGTRIRTPPFRRMERSRNVRVSRSSQAFFPSSGSGRGITRRTNSPNRTTKSSSSSSSGGATRRSTPVGRSARTTKSGSIN